MLDEVRALCGRAAALGLKRGDKIAIIGANRPRLYWAMCAAQALGAVPVPIYADAVADEMAYVLEHAEVRVAVVENQEQVDKMLSIVGAACPKLRHMVYDEPRGLRDYDRAKLSWIDDMQQTAARSWRSDPSAARWLEGAVAHGKGSRHLGHPLHVGHDRAAEGRDALRRTAASSRRRNGNVFDKLTRTRRRSPICRSPGSATTILTTRRTMSPGYCINCPESGRDRDGGPARDRPDLLLRAAAHLREPADPRMVRMEDAGWLKRRLFHYFIGVARNVGREDPQRRAGAAASAGCSTRSATCWSTAR